VEKDWQVGLIVTRTGDKALFAAVDVQDEAALVVATRVGWPAGAQIRDL